MKNKLLLIIAGICGCILFFSSCTKDTSCSNCVTLTADTTLTDTTAFTDCVFGSQRYFNIGGREGCVIEFWGDGSITTQNYFATASGKSNPGTATNRNSLLFYKGVQELDTLQPLKPQKAAYFLPGNYIYKTVYAPGDGVALSWTDGSGKKWQTDSGSGDQTGSYFTITATKQVIINGVLRGVIVNAVFSCNLYDGTGNVRRLVNGRFRLPEWI